MNNKGFTLIELLAVLAIISILTAVVTPNILKIINDNKDAQYVEFANEMLIKGKYYYTLKDKYQNLFVNNGDCYEISATNLGYLEKEDPDDGYYDLNESKVKICKENSSLNYYVKTYGSKKGIFDKKEENSYINENELNGTNKIVNEG